MERGNMRQENMRRGKTAWSKRPARKALDDLMPMPPAVRSFQTSGTLSFRCGLRRCGYRFLTV